MEEPQRRFEDFIYIPSIIFKLIGFDVLRQPKPLWLDVLMRFYFVVGLLTHYYIIYYMILRIVQWDTLAGDPAKIVQYAEILFLSINSEIKIYAFIYYRHRIRDLSNNLGNIFPRELSERRNYHVNRFYWPRLIRYAIYYFCFVVLLVVFQPLAHSSYVYIQQRMTLGSAAKFPYLRAYPMYLDFDSNTPLTYVLTEVLEFTSSHFYMSFNIGTDVWMMCLSAQLCMHFSHLNEQLETYKPCRERTREDCEFLIGIVRRHRHLLKLHKELNDIFGMLLAYNLFTTASLLCCVAFYTLIRGLNLEGISFLSYFFSCAAQFYIVCYYGQQLFDLSEKLPQAAYMQTWYNGSVAYRKQLLYFMLNTKNPVMLSAKGVIIISLDTFKNMMNITYRFFAIMQRLLDN